MAVDSSRTEENNNSNNFVNIELSKVGASPEKANRDTVDNEDVERLGGERDRANREFTDRENRNPATEEDGHNNNKEGTHFHGPHGVKTLMYGEITWSEMWEYTKEFLRDPLNVALVIWLGLSGIVFAFLGLSAIGALDNVFGDEATRVKWTDISIQVLDALFVLMTVVFHPGFFLHTFYLIRWRLQDRQKLRAYYCRGGFKKPHDRFHMWAMVIQLHVTCLSMYAVALVFWVYPYGSRPSLAVWITATLTTVAPITTFLYAVLSPLQRDYHERECPTNENEAAFRKKRMVFALDGVKVESPQWQGSIVPGCCSGTKTACLTVCLPFVVFGMHMHRLHFGNTYIHAITFLLVFLGPLFLFLLASVTVSDRSTRSLIAGVGLVLTELSLVYGALWRIQMRKQFHLPGNKLCCGNPSITDCCAWLICPCCALCQEARTSQHYQALAQSESGAYEGNGSALNPESGPLSQDDGGLKRAGSGGPQNMPGEGEVQGWGNGNAFNSQSEAALSPPAAVQKPARG